MSEQYFFELLCDIFRQSKLVDILSGNRIFDKRIPASETFMMKGFANFINIFEKMDSWKLVKTPAKFQYLAGNNVKHSFSL